MNIPSLPNTATVRSPVIVPGQGIRIDNRWAGKLVDVLIDLVRREEELTVAALSGIRTGGNSSGLFSEKAQRRWYDKIVRAAQHIMLASSFRSGNRRRFDLLLVRLATGTKDRNSICVAFDSVRGSPAKIDQNIGSAVRLTPHFLQRLIQRGGVTSVDDLVQILRANIPVILPSALAFPQSTRNVWIVPMTTPAGIGRMVLQKEARKGGFRISAKTFMPPNRSASEKIARLTDLHARMVANYENVGLGEELASETVKLLDEAAVTLGAKEAEEHNREAQ